MQPSSTHLEIFFLHRVCVSSIKLSRNCYTHSLLDPSMFIISFKLANNECCEMSSNSLLAISPSWRTTKIITLNANWSLISGFQFFKNKHSWIEKIILILKCTIFSRYRVIIRGSPMLAPPIGIVTFEMSIPVLFAISVNFCFVVRICILFGHNFPIKVS